MATSCESLKRTERPHLLVPEGSNLKAVPHPIRPAQGVSAPGFAAEK